VRIPENKEEYAKEIEDVLFDINTLLPKSPYPAITAEFLRDLIVLAQFNTHIWYNESEARKGNKDGNLLMLTHSINGIRTTARNKMNAVMGERLDYKVDCLAADCEQWRPSGY
jgi:hypothetical protein